jgi:cell shape-determining protein MreC
MNFPLQNKRLPKVRTKNIFLVFVSLVLLLFIVNYFTDGSIAGVVRTPTAAVFGVGGVLERVLVSVQDSVAQKKALRKERDTLKDRVRELELYALNNMILVSENEELRRLLGADKRALNRGILGRVLSRGGSYPYGTILISLEAPVAPAVGALVFGDQNIAIGRIEEIRDSIGVVTLISAPGQETSVMIVGADNTSVVATLRGVGSGNMVTEVARDAAISVGDPVAFYGRETALVGFVGSIETKPVDARKLVRVRTPLNLDVVRFVRVQ